MYPVIARTEMMYSTPLTCVVKSMSVGMVSSPRRLFFRAVAVLFLPVLPRQVRFGGPPPERHARPELVQDAAENPPAQQVERRGDDGDGQQNDVQPAGDDHVEEQEGKGDAAVRRLPTPREDPRPLHFHEPPCARFPVGTQADLLSAGEFLHFLHLPSGLAGSRQRSLVPASTLGNAHYRDNRQKCLVSGERIPIRPRETT